MGAQRRGLVATTDAWCGGLYGVAIGGLFAGESMFHRRTDASKVALVGLVERRCAGEAGQAGCSTSSGAPTTWPRWARSRSPDATSTLARPARRPRLALGRSAACHCGLDGETMARPSPPRAEPPWLMRTYSGHSTATASNELYRTNLAKGQTGLSIAFDLPTQTGYDPDDPLARGEVGKVGVPVAHLGHMRAAARRHPARAR